jgi:hypothetical protein
MNYSKTQLLSVEADKAYQALTHRIPEWWSTAQKNSPAEISSLFSWSTCFPSPGKDVSGIPATR